MSTEKTIKRFVTMSCGGYVENGKPQPEPLYPAGHSLENETKPKSNPVHINNSNLLLPTGFAVQANGSIETPLERQTRLLKKQRKEEQLSVDVGEMLLPAGITLEG